MLTTKMCIRDSGLNDRWPTGVYMAEDSTNFLKVTAPTRYDGIGFDYKWEMCIRDSLYPR